jgi:hypothetical protein
MHGAARGKSNSPDGVRSNDSGNPVREPCEGCLSGERFAARRTDKAGVDRDSGAPAISGRKACQREARGRSTGESPGKVPAVSPERAKPKGASGGHRTNPAAVARDSRKGQSPEAAARWAGPPPRRREKPTGKTARGCFRPETWRIPSERRKLRRANPMSAAGMKKGRHGLGGSKPPRGQPNPEGGT